MKGEDNAKQEDKNSAPTQNDISKNDESQEIGAPKKSKKKVIFIAIFLILLLASGGGIFFYLKKQKAIEEAKKKEEELKNSKQEIIYHDMDDIMTNLNSNKGASYLRMKLTLEIEGNQNLEVIKKFSPKIKDAFQLYLRELRPEDMQGSIGLYRLKEELLLRINKVVYPAQVNDILFKDVLVQ